VKERSHEDETEPLLVHTYHKTDCPQPGTNGRLNRLLFSATAPVNQASVHVSSVAPHVRAWTAQEKEAVKPIIIGQVISASSRSHNASTFTRKVGTACTLAFRAPRSQPSRSASASGTGILSTASPARSASLGADASDESEATPAPAPAPPNGSPEDDGRGGRGARRTSARTAPANVGLRARQRRCRDHGRGPGRGALDEERHKREEERHERVRDPVDDLPACERTGGEAQAGTDPECIHGQVVDRAVLVLRKVARDLQDVAHDCARRGRQLGGGARAERAAQLRMMGYL
jgi:hypothetical protein